MAAGRAHKIFNMLKCGRWEKQKKKEEEEEGAVGGVPSPTPAQGLSTRSIAARCLALA